MWKRLAGLLILAAAPAGAQVRLSDAQGNPLPDRANMANAGDFGVVLISTTNIDKLFKDWANPAPAIALETQTQAVRNQLIFTFAVVGGCAANAEGNCDVTASVQTFSPDGKPYENKPPRELSVWKGPPPANNHVQLSEAGAGLFVEDGEPLGTYAVRFTITDNVVHRKVTAQQELVIGEAAPQH